MAIYIVKNKGIYEKIKMFLRGVSVFTYFLGVFLTFKYDNGLIFIAGIGLAWFVSYVILGLVISGDDEA